MKKFFIIFCLFICAVSCKKYGHGHIKGQVTETDTGNPIPNARVVLGKWKKKPISGSSEYEVIDSTFTDSNGEYSLSIDKERKYRYSIHCSSPDYYEEDSYEINYKKTKHDFSLDPLGFVQVRLRKTSQSFTFASGSVNYHTFDYFYREMPFDTILPTIYRARGNAVNYIDWSIHSLQDGVPTITFPRQEIFVARRETTLVFFQIN